LDVINNISVDNASENFQAYPSRVYQIVARNTITVLNLFFFIVLHGRGLVKEKARETASDIVRIGSHVFMFEFNRYCVPSMHILPSVGVVVIGAHGDVFDVSRVNVTQ
jgi:hypothetical protein